MKKLVIVLCITLMAISIALIVFITKFKTPNAPSKKTAIITAQGVTLNGVSVSDADKMVTAFVNDNTSSDNVTDVWLSKAWVDNTYNLLNQEETNDVGTDGFRIYFAKRLDNAKNTVVIVSTQSGGPNGNAESGDDHIDYFDHTSSDPYITVKEDWAGDKGATLYNDPIVWPKDTCSTSSLNRITCIEAYNAVQNFKKMGAKQGMNTYSEWFPFCLLYNLQAELNAAAKKYPPNTQFGIRIYFAKKTTIASNSRHKNRHSFIFVTTVQIGGVNQDYYQCYNTDDNCNDSHKFFSSNDNGEECPNNCDGTALPKP